MKRVWQIDRGMRNEGLAARQMADKPGMAAHLSRRLQALPVSLAELSAKK